MAKKKKIDSAKFQIIDFFDEHPVRVFTYEDLADIMFSNNENWNLAARQTVSGFVDFLLANTKLEMVLMESENFPKLKRYIWGEPSVYAVAQTIKKKSYLSHGTAVFLLGHTDLLPKTVHLNFEQSPLMDMSMPVMDGLTATRLIRESNKITKLPIIAVTAHGQLYYSKAIDAGCNDLIDKPVDFSTIESVLVKYLNS